MTMMGKVGYVVTPLSYGYFHTLLKIVVMAGLVQFDSYTIQEAKRFRHSYALM